MEKSGSGSLIHFSYNEEYSYFTLITFVSSTVGIALAILAFTLLISTAILFPKWRQSYKNQLIIQFMIARMWYTLVRYVYDIRNFYNFCDINCIIHFDKFIMLYTECAVISWMFVFSKHMSDSLVQVLHVPKYSMWKQSLLTWTIPALISGLYFLGFILHSSGDVVFFLIYLFVIKWPALSANAVFLIQALMSILVTNQSRTQNNTRIVIVMIVLIFTFCFQQILVDTYKLINVLIFDDNNTALLNIFNILSIYHCAFSILFWVFGNSNTRKLWKFSNSALKHQVSVRSNSSASD